MQMMGQMKKMVGNRNPDEVINELVSSGRVNQSQLEQAKQMCGVVRYPMTYAYSAGASPFCGGPCAGNAI